MKIALIGNMNNNCFAYCRHLRDRGLNADLFLLNNEFAHFLPECDTFDLSHRSYTHSLNFGNPYWFLEEISHDATQQDITTLSKYDKIIACGSALAFLEYFKLTVDIFVPYGHDAYCLPVFIPSSNPKHREHLDSFSAYQAAAIKHAKSILATKDFLHIPCYADVFHKLEVTHKLIGLEYLPFIYESIYTPQNIPAFFDKSYWADDFKKLRNHSALIIISPVRHVWRDALSPDSKANDVLIKAFAVIRKEHARLNPLLILFEYGADVASSKQLVHSLGLKDCVVWMPQMNRKDIMIALYYCDIVAESFALGYAMGGVIAESIVGHKMLLKHSGECENYQALSCSNSDSIIKAVGCYCENRGFYDSVCVDNFAWLQKHKQRALDMMIKQL